VPGDFDGEFLLPTLQAYSAGRCVAIVQGRELRDDLLLGAKTFNPGVISCHIYNGCVVVKLYTYIYNYIYIYITGTPFLKLHDKLGGVSWAKDIIRHTTKCWGENVNNDEE